MSVTAAPILVDTVLGRSEYEIPISRPLARLADERILITGSQGSIGSALSATLYGAGIVHSPTDILDCDIRRVWQVNRVIHDTRPSVIFHLAGAKHAPEGERDPWGVCHVNTLGTRNVLNSAKRARVVLASTCKACDPETAYGASKLLAERMVLNAGGSVARFHNVVETGGNVFEFWRNLPTDEPLSVTSGSRHFISLREAIALTLWAAVLPTGRYCILPQAAARRMVEVASGLYPGRPQQMIEPRRGDREVEPHWASRECAYHNAEQPTQIMRVISPHDHAS